MPLASVAAEQRRTLVHGATRPPSHVLRELFRAYTDLFHIAGHATHGEAKSSVERDVGRVVHSLSGPSPASGGLRLPRSPTAALDAPGRFLYLLLRLVPGRPYAVHADLTTSDRATHRLTVSNQFGSEAGAAARARRTGVHVFLEAADEAWTLLAVDLAAVAVQATGGAGPGRPPGAGAYASLARLAFCSCCAVRGAFTSDLRYSWDSLPEDVGFAASFDAQAAGAHTVWVPEEPAGGSAKVAAPVRRAAGPLPPVPRRSALRQKQQQPASCSAADSEQQSRVPQMHPEPIAELALVSGFAARCSQPLVWVPGGSEVLFAASNTVVAMKPIDGGAQRHLGGAHAHPVIALAVSGNGALLASAEEGPEGTVQLWALAHSQPLASLAHGGAIICLSLSADGSALLTAGVSAGGRQELVWWDVSACRTGGAACELARQQLEHSVLGATFHPHLPDVALTCGKNSVRVHRLQDGQLRGLSVPMNGVRSPRRRPYSCGTLASATSTSVGEVFTCMAFEQGGAPPHVEAAAMLHVGTASGAVYLIDASSRAVLGVHQLHDGPVHALAVAPGFVATAGGDRLLRLWGRDLLEMYMEASHEGPVVGLALSPDGLRLASATECGTLGLLDPRAQRYSTLLRAHSGNVGGVAAAGGGSPPCFVTASADGTARLWDAASGRQTLELYSPAEGVECVAAAPDGTQVACGFGCGAVRVFDVAGAALVAENRQHGARVLALAYGQRGRTLFSLGADGAVWAYDAARAHAPARLLCAGAPLRATCMAVSADGRALALAVAAPLPGSIGRKDGRAKEQAIQFYSTAALELLAQLPVDGLASAVAHLALLPGRHRRVVLAATADGRLQGYSSASGQLVLDVAAAHPGGCQAMAADDSGTFLATASRGGRIRVWGLHALHQMPPAGGAADAEAEASPLAGPEGVICCLPCQLLTGHPGAVLGLAFVAGGSQLVSTGTQGVVCSWLFHGKPCNSDTSAPANLTSAVVLASAVPPAQQQQQQQQQQQTENESSEEQHGRLPRPTFNLTADCRAAATLAPPPHQAARAPFFPPQSSSPTPRALPAALQSCVHQRPPSAPAVLVEPLQTHAAGTYIRPSSSLPTSPLRARKVNKQQPLGSTIQYNQQRMIITTDCTGERQVQSVRQERALVISSPAAGKERSVRWEARDVPGDVVPAYRPRSQPQLLPPRASLGHVLGFTATAGFEWCPDRRSVVIAAGSTVLMEHLEHDNRQQQQLVAQLPGPVTAVASTPDCTLLASAVAPSCSGGGSSDILLREACGAHRATLRFHLYAVQKLAFSPDGAWLASVGGSPEPGLALWSAHAGELVAAAPLQAPLDALAWLPSAEASAPVFYTATGGALARWTLGSDDLSCVAVNLGRALAGQTPLTALCCPPADAVDCPGCPEVVLAGDSRGRIWELALDSEQELSSYRALAEVEGGAISYLAASPGLIAAGTASGALLLLLRDSDSEGGWRAAGCCQLDGAVLRVQADAGAQSAVASTAVGTLWQASFHGCSSDRQPRVLLCGQQHTAAAWAHSAGASWRKGPALLAMACPTGVAIWHAEGECQSPALPRSPLVECHSPALPRSPLVEFVEPCDATHVALARDSLAAAAAYADGSLCLFGLEGAPCLRWKAPAPRPGAVAGLALTQRLRGTRLLVAYADGALLLLEGVTGRVAGRLLAGSSGSASGSDPVCSLSVCPSDSSLLMVCRRASATAYKVHVSKSAGAQELASVVLDNVTTEAAAVAAPAAVVAAPAPGVVGTWSTRHEGHFWLAGPARPGQLLLLDTATGAVIKTSLLPCAAPLTALAVPPGEALLAAGAADGSLLLLRADTEAWAQMPAAHEGSPVLGLAFSSCGRWLYSGGTAATLVWDLKGEAEGEEAVACDG